MIKDLAVIIDSETKNAASGALSLTAALQAHFTVVSTVIEPDLPSHAYADDLVASTREGRRLAVERALETIKIEGQRGGISLDLLEDGSLDRLQRMAGFFDLIIVEQAPPEGRGAALK
jgi:hypothetical protein